MDAPRGVAIYSQGVQPHPINIVNQSIKAEFDAIKSLLIPVEPARGVGTSVGTIYDNGQVDGPGNVIRYGDGDGLSADQARRLIGALRQLAEFDPWFRDGYWASESFGALAQASLLEEIRTLEHRAINLQHTLLP